MRRVAWLLFVVGCGGHTIGRSDGAASDAVAGSTTTQSPPSSGGVGGAGGTLFVPLPDIPSQQPQTCATPTPSCHIKDTYVEVYDDPPARLTPPRQSGCASCWVACEDCDFTCELSATGRASCGYAHLQMYACADGDSPCLDTTAVAPYYVDAAHKTWSVLSFSGAAPTANGAALLDSDITLTLSDGAVTRDLISHVRVCADLTPTAAPCK